MAYVSPKYKKILGLNMLQTERFRTVTERFVVISRTSAASLAYLVSGKVALSSGDISFEAKAGDALWFPSGILYRALWQGSPILEFYSLHWSGVGETFYPLQKIPSLSRPDTLPRAALVHRLISEGESEADTWTAAAEFCRLAAEAAPCLVQSDRPRYPEALSAALHYCERHCLERFSNEALAKECHISEPRLYSLFRTCLKTTPVSYVNSLRVAEASRLLIRGQLTVEQIADHCGFGSTNYFREVFHEATGQSPTDYRRAAERLS